MADDLEPFRVTVGHDADLGVVIEAEGHVDHLAVDAAGQRRLGEAGADARGNVGHGDGLLESLLLAVGKCDYGHGRESTKWAGRPTGLPGSGLRPVAGRWCALVGSNH